jgi:putative ABC transport system permease protein
MLRNYFIIAARTLRMNMVFSTLNILGLSIGIASCLVVGLFVVDQYSYDAHHENAENIYRVVNKQQSERGEAYVALTQGVLGTELPKVFPEIRKSARVGFIHADIQANDTEPIREKLMAVDKDFFSMFTVPFSIPPSGDIVSEDGILISKAAAETYFGNKNPIGKVISIPGFVELKVRGVFKDFPYQTHLHADLIISFIWIEKTEPVASSWSSNSYFTYLLMPEDFDVESFNKKMNAFIGKHTPGGWESFTYFLQPLTSINLQPGYAGNPKGSIGKIIIIGFAIVGSIILFLACLNYMNVSTARSAKRSLEVGVRKVMGADRTQIVWQFLMESLILCMLSFLLALLWADIAVPAFNTFTGLKLSLTTLYSLRYISVLICCVLLLGFLAGSYPALFLSRFVPVAVLKGQKSADASRRVRKGLVVLQFTITTALTILVIVVWKQTNYMRTKNLGFNKEALLVLPAELNKDIGNESFKSELQKITGVRSITSTTDMPGSRMNSTDLYPESKSEKEGIKILWTFADHDYIPTLELQLLAGENFKNDTSSVHHVIINEMAASAFGWTAEQAIGKLVAGFTFKKSSPGKVIGVIKNFHISPLRKEIMPFVIGYSANNPIYLARLEGTDLFNTKDKINSNGARFVHGNKLESTFLEEALEESYAAETKTGQLLTFFTMMAIILGCSGLYALTAYEGEQRIKELGIRKIMGASSAQMLILLSRNFLKPILVSLFIGMPLAYYLGNIWLNVYPYRITWTADIFIISSSAILLLGWITILSQAIKAIRLNPVDALRYE